MRVLRTDVFPDRLVGVRYGALGRSLLLRCLPWKLWRWGLAAGEEPVGYGEDGAGWDPYPRARACLFVPGGEAFLRANGFWPAGADLPPPLAERANLERLAPFGPGESFVPRAFRGGRAFLAWRYREYAWAEPILCNLAGRRL